MSRRYPPLPAGFLWRHPAHLLAFGFGAGAIRVAPGTWGTLVALPLCWLLPSVPTGAFALFIVVAFAVGVWLCDVTGRHLGVGDHPGMVWDEMVGYWIAIAALPPRWEWWLAAFVLFRIFDIWKPWPIGELDRRLHGGLGVMVDDAVAGLLTGAILFVASHWIVFPT